MAHCILKPGGQSSILRGCAKMRTHSTGLPSDPHIAAMETWIIKKEKEKQLMWLVFWLFGSISDCRFSFSPLPSPLLPCLALLSSALPSPPLSFLY